MPIYTDVFLINEVHALQQDGEWPATAYVPPPQEAVWFGGGISESSVDRLTISTDTNTASARGPLSAAARYVVATGNTTNGWFTGSMANQSRVERITFSSDTMVASIRGPLAGGTYGMQGALSSSTSAYIAGGVMGSSVVNRINFATDTATATLVGPLSISVGTGAGVSDTTTFGWFGGGLTMSPFASRSTINRITYASDTSTTSSRGPLSVGRYRFAASFNSSFGWFTGGLIVSSPNSSIVDRLTYSNDTTVAATRGSLDSIRYDHAAGGNSSAGYLGGGGVPSTTSSVTRITYATDTATSVIVGPRSNASQQIGGTSGVY